MKTIDESRLEQDLEYRYLYLAEFMGFTKEDVAAIHAVAPELGPRVTEVVEKTYEKLLAYDATARHFVPRQHGFGGDVPGNIGQLAQTHEQIQFRKEHLMRYLMQILGRPFDAKFVTYLDVVGKIHTAKAGNPEIVVPLVQMNALLGWLADVLTATIAGLDLDAETKWKTIRAFQKFLWIQNDFISRHYTE